MRLMDGVPDLQKECDFYDSKLAELQVPPRPLGVSEFRYLVGNSFSRPQVICARNPELATAREIAELLAAARGGDGS